MYTEQINGLLTWNERQIMLREMAVTRLSATIRDALQDINKQWRMRRIDAPILTLRENLSEHYGPEDIWLTQAPLAGKQECAIRPETTPSSYIWLANEIKGLREVPPICVWQFGKSFRREVIQPTKYVRLKEFYQLEYQCVMSADTQVDYHTHPDFISRIEAEIRAITGCQTRVVPSDRLPAYSRRTDDIEVFYAGRWMEVASISLRTDVPFKFKYQFKGEQRNKDLINLEIAFGADRIVVAAEQMQFSDDHLEVVEE